jgi:phosphatidylglycerol:prolipoprotein diacylglycerol transferase
MYPHDLHVFGLEIAIWNVLLLLGILAGYPVLLASLRARRRGAPPRFLPLRWIVTVYVSAIGAQLFAYFFDLNTTALPPPTVGWARYYLDPLFGPKTLYGAIVFLPVTLAAIVFPWRDLGYVEALDAWTPPMFVVLGIARVGCFLQGCCYGVHSERFGISFPFGSPSYYHQLNAKLIAEGETALPVIPTQAIEALVLFGLAAWFSRRLRQGDRNIFPAAVALYSLLRFVLEFARDDPDRNFLGVLSTSQWIALVALALVAATAAWRRSVRA